MQQSSYFARNDFVSPTQYRLWIPTERQVTVLSQGCGYSLNLLNLRELVTTDTELNAMAPAAIMGLRKPSAATGNARTL